MGFEDLAGFAALFQADFRTLIREGEWRLSNQREGNFGLIACITTYSIRVIQMINDTDCALPSWISWKTLFPCPTCADGSEWTV